MYLFVFFKQGNIHQVDANSVAADSTKDCTTISANIRLGDSKQQGANGVGSFFHANF